MTIYDDMASWPDARLYRLYTALPRGPLPWGAYDGRVCGLGRSLVGLVWQGKVFAGESVVNRVFGLRLIEGRVHAQDTEIVIEYPQLGNLRDTLRYVEAGSFYLGYLVLGWWRIWFTLRATV